jgi:hypothetical protein
MSFENAPHPPLVTYQSKLCTPNGAHSSTIKDDLSVIQTEINSLQQVLNGPLACINFFCALVLG